MNVKNFAFSSRKRLKLSKPLYRSSWEESETVKFLKGFLAWMQRWNDDLTIESGQKLKVQTYSALFHSTENFLELVSYLFKQYADIDYTLFRNYSKIFWKLL